MLQNLARQAASPLERLLSLMTRLLQGLADLLKRSGGGAAAEVAADARSADPRSAAAAAAAADRSAAALWLEPVLESIEATAAAWETWLRILQEYARRQLGGAASWMQAALEADTITAEETALRAALRAMMAADDAGSGGGGGGGGEEEGGDAAAGSLPASAPRTKPITDIAELMKTLKFVANVLNQHQSHLLTLQAALWTLLRPILCAEGMPAPPFWWLRSPASAPPPLDHLPLLSAAHRLRLGAVLAQLSLLLRMAPVPLRLWTEPAPETAMRDE